MKRIYTEMLKAKNQYYYGLISRLEYDLILTRLDIELMGCDSI